MGAPPDRGMTRCEIHEGIRLAADELIRLYDASEDASTGEERERADKELYNFMLGLLADVAGPAIGRVLERERDCPLPGEPDTAIKGTWHDQAGVNRALAWLLLNLKPALGDFPAKQVVHDLLAAVTDNASPLILKEPKRGRGEHDDIATTERSQEKGLLAISITGETGLPINA